MTEAPIQSLQVSKQAIMKAKMSNNSKRKGKAKGKKENAYYHVSITKLQTAFEKQFFEHIFSDGTVNASVQTDDLSVIKKHRDY